ncbi:MAG: hypothetical protein IPI41_03110 [Flavobacteriales bacterium]|nr:hypothetical protein [Flavobacteriales bacterium]
MVQNAAFTFWNTQFQEKGEYFRLIDFNDAEVKRSKLTEAVSNPESEWYFRSNQSAFFKVPGSPIAYWLSERIATVFESTENMANLANPKVGMQTANNAKFLRYWHEIDFNFSDPTNETRAHWVKYIKGGEFRRWYGNLDFVLNMKDDGRELKSQKNATLLDWSYLMVG